MSQIEKEEVLLQTPGCSVNPVDESEDSVTVSLDNNVTLEITISVGPDLTLPEEDSDPLSYEVTFTGEDGDVVESLEFLKDFVRENSGFSSLSEKSNEIDYEKFSLKPEEYKSGVAKVIAEGTKHIIKGIFTCSNAYAKKVYSGGSEITITKETGEKSVDASPINGGDKNGTKKKNKMDTNLQRAEILETVWDASEAIGEMVLDGEGMLSGLMIDPVVKSSLGQAFLSTAPGEVLLASLDAFSSILGAAEAAQIQTYCASSMATIKLVSNSCGENVGNVTGKMLETTGNLGRVAWKIGKALEPTFSVAANIVKNAPRQ
uniref:Senescence domain-containing protein n=1 Tax=Noccaea caerulescens TaxID=107243 RepID=A0A1J3D0S9_NOCCA